MYFSHLWLSPVAAKSRISKGTLKNVFSVAKLYYGLPRWGSGKDPACNAGDTRDVGLIPGLGRPPRRGSGNPFQYSCLENSMDRGTWWATVHGSHKESDRTEHTCLTSLTSSHVMWYVYTQEASLFPPPIPWGLWNPV